MVATICVHVRASEQERNKKKIAPLRIVGVIYYVHHILLGELFLKAANLQSIKTIIYKTSNEQ